MTSKVFRTAQGKSVDLGTIMLQNEHVRAVGNMNVNARGDKLDHNNHVIETKPRQIQRQNSRTTNVSADPVQTSATKANKIRREKSRADAQPPIEAVPIEPEPTPQAVMSPPEQNIVALGTVPEGGLATAIARNREIKQELEKTRQQQQKSTGLRKI
jgi:hypothetical protein